MKNDNEERNLCLAIIFLFEIQVLSGVLSMLTLYTSIKFADLLTQMEIDPNSLDRVVLITFFLFLICHGAMLSLCISLRSLYPQNRLGRAMLFVIALMYIAIFTISIIAYVNTVIWFDNFCSSGCGCGCADISG